MTTSWDDGHVLDLRLADLLDRHGIAGTFYVAPRSHEIPAGERLDDARLRALAARFEIGGHTLTHRRLPTLDAATARHEIRAGRDAIEQAIGRPVTTFCYPGGSYRPEHVAMARDEGFVLARTVRRYQTRLPQDLLETGTTVHAYRHLRDPPRLIAGGPLRGWRRSWDWADLAIHQFDRVRAGGGVFHLWGHSWEIDGHGDWDRLDRVLAHIGGVPGVRYVPNGALVPLLPTFALPRRPDDDARGVGARRRSAATPSSLLLASAAPDSPNTAQTLSAAALVEQPAAPARPVVQVVPYYPPHLGGTENVARALAEGLAADRPVSVLTSRSGSRHVPRVERQGNLTVRRLRTLEAHHLPVMPGLLPALWREPGDAVVHVHVTQAFTPETVWLAARLRRRGYVAHFHLDVDPSGPLGRLHLAHKRWVLGPVLRQAATVVVLSESQRALVAGLHRVDERRLAVLPNGVDGRFFLPARPRSPGPLRLLFVGRLGEQKNVARLLAALALVREPVTLDIVGAGELRADLERTRTELGLTSVRFRGTQTGDALVACYRWADAFVLPSNKEGMPLALLEAMAASLPVIGTAVAGTTDVVGDDGLLVAPDPAALAGAIDRLAADEALRSRLAARAGVRAQAFSWPAILATLDGIYGRRL